ncbi:hypothetical protein [Flagellimonas sp. 2504JD1-5]
MRKFIFKISLFLFSFLLINILYLVIIQNLDWNFYKRVESLNLNKPTYENIILGNSLAMDGIDCRLFSNNPDNTYNLAIGGASLNTNYIQLLEYLEIAQTSPKRVVLGIGSYRENSFKKNKIHPMVEFTKPGYNYKLTDLPVLKFKWIFKELIKKIISADHRNAELVQGQLRISRTVPDKTQNKVIIGNVPFAKYQNSNLIKQIAQLCNQNKIEFILVEMPGFRKTRNNNSIGPYEMDYQLDKKVKLYNFNGSDIDTVLNPNEDWLGGSHLNKQGAIKFTKFIKNYIIP